jgi:meso-butanediol dehydrogenase/(S,S)-butanediol dehydrogenase/diacetyl reductase
MDFSGKTALITGAAGAIGKGIAQELLANGAKVFISDLKQDAVDAAVEEIGGGCLGYAADITKIAQVEKAVAVAAEAFNDKIDILVNVAGIIGTCAVEDITEEQWDMMMDVNCKGTFLFTKFVVPMMKANKYGKIVNFSSKSGKTGSALMSHYGMAKAGVMGFTQALAFELAPHINVNCVCPGITENTGVWETASAGYIDNLGMSRDEVIAKFTSKIPLQRLAKIEDVTAVTAFLCSKGSDYMTGQSINVTGGREMH